MLAQPPARREPSGAWHAARAQFPYLRRCALGGLVIWIGVRVALLLLGAAASVRVADVLSLTPAGSLVTLLLVAGLLALDLALTRELAFHANLGVAPGTALAAGLVLPVAGEALPFLLRVFPG